MPRQLQLTDEQSAHLRETVKRDLCNLVPTQLHLAPLLGITQGRLSRFLDGERGSFIIAFRAALLLGRSIESVLGIEGIRQLMDPQHKRYPTRIYAARAAYLDGVPIERIRAILSTSLKSDEDPGAAAWMKMMREGVLVKPGSRQDTDWAIDFVRPGVKAGTRKPSKKSKLR